MDSNSIVALINEEAEIQNECVKLLTEFNKQSMGTQIDYGRQAIVFRVGQEEILKRLMNHTVDLRLENNGLKEENEYLLQSANLVDKSFVESMHGKNCLLNDSNAVRNEEVVKEIEELLHRQIPRIL